MPARVPWLGFWLDVSTVAPASMRMISRGWLYPARLHSNHHYLPKLTASYVCVHASHLRLADAYLEAGFMVAIAEIVVGRLDQFCTGIKSRPLILVNLVPSLDVVKRRNEERPNKNVYEPWSPILDRAMRETMSGIGLWLDNSHQSSEETVDEILRRGWSEGTLE